MPDYPEELLPAPSDKSFVQPHIELISTLDEELAAVWGVMRRFCMQVNLGTQTQRLIYPEVIHGTMISVMYRLFGMSFAAGSIDEVVLLGLLAFSHHIFLQWQNIKLAHYPFIATYRKCIQSFNLAGETTCQLKLWLLVVGAISMFRSDEVWLCDVLRNQAQRCHVTSWKGMQEILKSFMWISLLDDQPGQHVYDSFRAGKEEGTGDTDVTDK